MIKRSTLQKDIYKPKDISQFLGVTTRTLQNWEYQGKILFKRNPISDRRYMDRDDVIELLQERNLLIDDLNDCKKDVIYARVSSHHQKTHDDLDRQVQFLIENNSDLKNLVVLAEVGSGLNDHRKKLQQLLKMVMDDEVNRVFVTYRDRLTRFGFNYLKTMFNAKGVQIVVVKQQAEKMSVEAELMNDMMSLIASFSGKLYGMRSRKNKLKKKEVN